MKQERILVLERNKLSQRKVTRVLACTGAKVVSMDSASELNAYPDEELAQQGCVLCADAVDLSAVLRALDKYPKVRALLWSSKPNYNLLRKAAENPRFCNLVGRPAPDDPPRSWELLWALRRLLTGKDPGFSSLLSWGYIGFKEIVRTSKERDACVEGVSRFCDRLNTPGHIREMLGELTHELLMNAMYDAPVGEDGKAKYAGDRRAEITLEENEAAVIKCGSDGERIAVSVTDTFGRLGRGQVFEGMHRGLSGGKMDTSGGGAGLGMLYIYKSTSLSSFTIVPGKRTEVVGLYELDLNRRDFRNLPRSVHVFEGNGA